MNLSTNVTPNGIPILSAAMLLGLFGVCIWDATRYRGEPWFRWLLPFGYIFLLLGISVTSLAFVIFGAAVGALGLGLTNYWRWTRR
jgi:hypothetical protein